MSAPIRSPRFGPPGAPASYLARPATWRRTALHRQAGQLIPALARRARRLHLPRFADYKLEPMPRTRWYS
jgi:hypothetical protein